MLARLCLPACFGAQDYSSTPLACGDRADTFLAEDVDGDGRRDLVVQSGLDLRFFVLGPGGFPAAPTFSLRLDATTFLWTLASFADHPKASVVTMSSRGIHRYVRADGGFAPRPQDLVIHPNIFEGSVAADQAPLHLDFMPELTGDGLRDAVLFAAGEILVLTQRKDAAGRPDFRLAQKLPLPIDSGLQLSWGPHQTVREVTSVPVIAYGDFNGDKRVDISYYLDESIGTFFQQPDGRFAAADERAVGEKRKRRNTFLRFEVPPQIVDLNGDGLLDVVVVYASKGRTHVYMNRDGKTDFSNPDAVLRVEDGWSTGAYVKDLDRDGTSEIIMGIVRKFGILGGLEVFTSKKIDLELHVFRFDAKAGTYNTQPVQQIPFRIPFTFQATRDSAQVDLTFRPNFDADVDGDGRIDLIVERDAQTLDVYKGTATGFTDKPALAISYRPPADVATTQPFIADFNGDGRSDFIMRYVMGDRRKHQVEVLISRK